MSYRAPHKKREAPLASEPESGEWVVDHSVPEGAPPAGSAYWSWNRIEAADWEDHVMMWRPRDEELSGSELITSVTADFESKHYSKLAARLTPGQALIAGRAVGKTMAASMQVMTAAMSSVATAVRKSIGPISSAARTVEMDSLSRRWKRRPFYRREDIKACSDMAKHLGASKIVAERKMSGFCPRHIELRCANCGAGGVTSWVAYLESRPDGRFRIEDGLGGVVKTARARWQKMTCEEVRRKLTILVVMES